jgi:hypothetical protein
MAQSISPRSCSASAAEAFRLVDQVFNERRESFVKLWRRRHKLLRVARNCLILAEVRY